MSRMWIGAAVATVAGVLSISSAVASAQTGEQRRDDYPSRVSRTPQSEAQTARGPHLGTFPTTLDSNGTWALLSNLGPPPPTFQIPLGVYDPVRDRLLVIESGNLGGSPPLAVLALDLKPEPHWSALVTAGIPPGERFVSSLVYDALRDRLLLFGGWGFNDVWELALSGTPTWQQLATTGGPPPWRGGHSAVYDPAHDRMIVFGGYATPTFPTVTYYSDTWALSLETNQWTILAPAGAPSSGRQGHRATYDPETERMLVFGGDDGVNLRNDLWALSLGDSSSWIELSPNGLPPPARRYFGQIYDPVRRQMVIHGGLSTDDVWTLSLSGSLAWNQVATLDTLYGRAYPVDVYDPVRDRLIVYGGASYAQSAGLPLAGPYRWTLFLPPCPPLAPGPHFDHAVVYDSKRERAVAFGGLYGSTDVNTWAFSPGDTVVWAPLLTPGSPGGLSLSAIYDPVGDRVALYDGVNTWALSFLPSPIWTRFEISGPPERDGASVIYDPVRHRMIIYGGEIYGPHSDNYTRSDIWALSLRGTPEWTRLGDGPVPYGSVGHSAFYDPLRDRMVVMGGRWVNGSTISHPYGSSIWATPLDSTVTWTILSLSGLQPPAPPDGQVIYDPNRDRMLLFSGSGVWTRPASDAGEWTALAPFGPGPFVGSPVVFDPRRDEVIALFTATPGAVADQVWALAFGPPMITLLRTTATFDEVEIAWHSSAAHGREATVQRREDAGGWVQIANLLFDVTGTGVLHDHDVSPGIRYAYRLGILEGTGFSYTDSVWVQIPARPVFALQGVRPNPAVRAFNVVFSLTDASPARLDVFDVRGRRILAREVGSFGPGTHSIDLKSDRPLSPGVYLIRLERNGQSLTTRGVIIR